MSKNVAKISADRSEPGEVPCFTLTHFSVESSHAGTSYQPHADSGSTNKIRPLEPDGVVGDRQGCKQQQQQQRAQSCIKRWREGGTERQGKQLHKHNNTTNKQNQTHCWNNNKHKLLTHKTTTNTTTLFPNTRGNIIVKNMNTQLKQQCYIKEAKQLKAKCSKTLAKR